MSKNDKKPRTPSYATKVSRALAAVVHAQQDHEKSDEARAAALARADERVRAAAARIEQAKAAYKELTGEECPL